MSIQAPVHCPIQYPSAQLVSALKLYTQLKFQFDLNIFKKVEIGGNIFVMKLLNGFFQMFVLCDWTLKLLHSFHQPQRQRVQILLK